jgi:ABC-type amino acid transport substrate-binding protein
MRLHRLALAPLVAVVAVSSLGVRAEAASAPLRAPGELVVALSLPAPGLQVGAVRGGEVVLARGLEVELAKTLARRLGRPNVRFVNRSRASLLAPGLKRWDLALAQIAASPAFARSVDFSVPYLSSGQAILVRRGAPPPNNAAALARLDVCARKGDSGVPTALRELRSSVRPVLAPDDDALLRLVQTGRCDAALVDAARLGPLLEGRRERFSPVRLRITERNIVVALPHGSELLPAVDRTVRKLVASGAIHRLAKSWLGLDPSRLRVLEQRAATAFIDRYPR